MWNIDATVSEIVQRTPTVKSFQFSASGLDFLAGQYMYVAIKVNGEDAFHHFSISNSPTDRNYIEFTKRITDSDYSKALDSMRPGDTARLRGPFGNFVLPDREELLCFLCGGIGITPLRSMLRYIAVKGLAFDVNLIYGAKDPTDFAFQDELDEISSNNRNIRVEYVQSSPDIQPGWKGKNGRIDKNLISELTPDYKDRLFYISGPPKMVTSLMEQVAQLGVVASRIKHDSFTGYD